MDAYERRRKDWEDLDVTKDELESFTECLKKDEFRKLLIEYAEEVSSPENRKLYEKELTELERERGVDITFVNPEPGYVIKTSLNGDKKCFVNISKSDKVGKPTSQPTYADGNRGLQWSLPYSLAPPREDHDKKMIRCTVFDVVFHPDTLYLASKNPRFAEMVNNTALDGVEANYKVKLDRKNVKFPKMTFKGLSQPTVIRKPSEKQAESSVDVDCEIYQKLMASYDESRDGRERIRREDKQRRAPPKTTRFRNEKPNREDDDSVYAVPKFTVKHRSDVDLQDFRDCIDARSNAAIPKDLVVVVDLPLLKSACDASLDVQERSLVVKSEKPARYLLELPLPYCVDADLGNAKFDSRCKKLTVTLPVVRKNLTFMEMRDSGVESDHGSPLTTPGDGTTGTNNNNNNDDDDDDEEEEEEEDSTSRDSRPDDDRVSSSENANVDNYHENTALRTNGACNSSESFLNPNVKYNLPPSVCNVYDDNFAITINVKNVDAASISYRPLDDNSGIHVILSSIGAGFFPIHYSLCMKIHENSILPESITVEPWDNNVVFIINLRDTGGASPSRYWIGMDEEFMEAKDLPSKSACLSEKFQRLMMEPRSDRDKKVEVMAEGEDVVINIQTSHLDSDDEVDRGRRAQVSSRKKERKHALSNRSVSVSESSGDELPPSSSVGSASGASKGILKSRRGAFSRSVSESSIDEAAGHLSSVDLHYDSIPDVNSESDCSSFKKSVRFNDVVSRQLYRSNSSILGQRKKNQRKLRNKKRAHERRMSESENSETEDREKYRISPKDRSEEDKGQDAVKKPILNRERARDDARSATRINEPAVKRRNPAAAEFKNDLIFDLDM